MIPLLLCILVNCAVYGQQMSVAVHASGVQKMPIALVTVTDHAAAQSVMQAVAKDLSFTGQCDVQIEQGVHLSGKQALKDLGKQGYALIVVTDVSLAQSMLECRLYHGISGAMIAGKKIGFDGACDTLVAHKVADSLWQAITGNPGFFTTKIAYCVEKPLADGTYYKHIVTADYDGSNIQPLVTTPTINLAPRWNVIGKKPLVFYSECTPSNIRLMVVDMHKKKTIVSNFDGLNMLPTFSHDGSKVVYCASKGDGACHLYYYDKGVFKKLTDNSGNNISPVFATDSLLFFCSDFKTGTPHIYSLSLATGACEQITTGYCSSPAFCQRTQKLAYCKAVQGKHQLFVYDVASKEHRQITYDDTKKEECSWSPCGTYVMCCVQKGSSSRVAMINTLTSQYQYITSEQQRCSYPSWSGVLA